MTPELNELREEYLALLDTDAKEQVYQKYLEENTRFIPREFVQNHGVSCHIALRKLPFGADYKSDFFFLSKSTTHWNAVHIEIEKPSSKFFKGNTTDFDPGFQHAVDQIDEWRAWFERGNEEAFRNIINPLLMPTNMARNPIKHKYVLVYGRRSEYADNDVRRTKVSMRARDDFKIMSFDSLAEGLAGKSVFNIGVRRNEYIDVIGDKIIDPLICGLIEPTRFRISETAHESLTAIIDGPGIRSQRFTEGKTVNSYQYAADRILVRRDKELVEDEA
ncbi:Shedu anti-phage system protein SduA domain-containing protein [Rhizobium ruizarguesonis]|uniref:Shedu anti-phage system protein SduA domain-containing protein n=1 Tax=Rhizobium ruizarguesonis TaxID=2081791 RepID=UPI0013EEA926|nr:Shedu anti-phage system protein SduA domain-containing protein [Rhizobium ruizarguesonis]